MTTCETQAVVAARNAMAAALESTTTLIATPIGRRVFAAVRGLGTATVSKVASIAGFDDVTTTTTLAALAARRMVRSYVHPIYGREWTPRHKYEVSREVRLRAGCALLVYLSDNGVETERRYVWAVVIASAMWTWRDGDTETLVTRIANDTGLAEAEVEDAIRDVVSALRKE